MGVGETYNLRNEILASTGETRWSCAAAKDPVSLTTLEEDHAEPTQANRRYCRHHESVPVFNALNETRLTFLG